MGTFADNDDATLYRLISGLFSMLVFSCVHLISSCRHAMRGRKKLQGGEARIYVCVLDICNATSAC